MTNMTAIHGTLRIYIMTALIAVYLFWGGTYLTIKIATDTIPPFIMGGLRFFTAGLIVYLWERYNGTPHPQISQWLGATKVSGLLLVCSMGGLVWAEQFVPSGIAAIIFATVPLWMALIAWIFQKESRPTGIIMIGLLLGFCGVILLVKNSVTHIGNNPLEWLGYVITTLASIAWAFGSLYSRIATLPQSSFMAGAIQNMTGGICYFLISILIGEWNTFSFCAVSLPSALSLIYLIIFGSLIGFGAYIWLLKVADPTMVSTYAYVNPIVAVFLGWILAGETLTSSDTLAAALIVCAVIIMTKNQTQAK